MVFLSTLYCPLQLFKFRGYQTFLYLKLGLELSDWLSTIETIRFIQSDCLSFISEKSLLISQVSLSNSFLFVLKPSNVFAGMSGEGRDLYHRIEEACLILMLPVIHLLVLNHVTLHLTNQNPV